MAAPLNLKSKILAVTLKLKKVRVPEWNMDLYLKRLTCNELVVYEEARFGITDAGDPRWTKARSTLLALCLCDEKGNRVFDDADEINQADHIVVDRLGVVALEHNGLTKASREEIEKKVSQETGSTSSSQIASE